MKMALNIAPENAEVNSLIGSFFRSIGLYEQAIKFFSRALELDPNSLEFVFWHDLLADSISCMGRFEEAAESVQKALEIQPDRDLYLNYAWQLIMMKKYEQAKIQIAKAEELSPNSRYVKYHRALLLSALGDNALALSLIRDEEEAFRYIPTSIYAFAGLINKAIENISKGIEVGFNEVGMCFYSYPFLSSNPFYDVLRGDPRYQKIMAVEKKRYEEKIEKYGGF